MSNRRGTNQSSQGYSSRRYNDGSGYAEGGSRGTRYNDGRSYNERSGGRSGGGGGGGGGGRSNYNYDAGRSGGSSGGGRSSYNYDAGRSGGGGGAPRGGTQRSRGSALRQAAVAERSQAQKRQHGQSLCTEYTMKANCRFGEGCRYAHKLRCVGTKLESHQDAILHMAIGPLLPTGYELFTTGRDHRLKRWQVTKDGGVAQGLPVGTTPTSLFPTEAVKTDLTPAAMPHYELKLIADTPLQAAATAMLLHENILLIGLAGGLVIGFERQTGSEFRVVGHEASVNSIILMRAAEQVLLVTGDMHGSVRFWIPALSPEGTPQFNAAQKILAPFGVTRLMHIENTRLLIVGGLKRVGVYDLGLGSWTTVYDCTAANEREGLCLRIMKINELYVALFGGGEAVCFSAEGALQATLQLPVPSMLTSAVYMATAAGPRLVTGHVEGHLVSTDLATLEPEWHLLAHDDDIRDMALVTAAPLTLPAVPSVDGTPAIALTVAADGAIALWCPADGSDNKPATSKPRLFRA